MNDRQRVAHVIGFAAPPVVHLGDFVRLLAGRGWDSYVILSPIAATWVDADSLTRICGHNVRVAPRGPHEPNQTPVADAVFAAPLTFNSLNKWASGISDTPALGVLNESLGLKVPVIAAPCIKKSLQRHPAYTRSVAILTAADVTVLESGVTMQDSSSSPDTLSLDWSVLLAQQQLEL